ncbi:helix-turn-helix domain-containing protein [Flavobacterium gelatinilyticum]|uniref:helix-turn-helix domain-containing protein n=1 Tax=Flavobacterium gelatinilyticum TaxID=3003260 RepID=UPI0024805C9F|nr:AraC family transcriptional regulator [Flavobacterium gelatinilyticum]
MKNITHYYSLTPEWQQQIADQLNIKVKDNKLLVFPKPFGRGFSYFTQVTSGISVVLLDFTPTVPIKITRLKSESPIYIFHFELSEHTNLIKINNKDYDIGPYQKLDLAIIDNELQSSFKLKVNRRAIAIRILVNKSMLNDFTSKFSEKKDIIPYKESGAEVFYHYGNIDSNSTVLVQSLKNKKIDDLSFDSMLKGISLKLLGNFLNKFYQTKSPNEGITKVENEAITKTRDYLLNNLYGPFPSVTFLAAMAGMSESKYKLLFKKCFKDSPNSFFITEKMKLAQLLLQSGNYHTLTEVIYELNYTKLSYFSSKYQEICKAKPTAHFVKNHTQRTTQTHIDQ